MKLIDIIIKGHTDNILTGKLNGEFGDEVLNNQGVFQGSPISALLYIIFADGIMGEYKDLLNNIEHGKINLNVKNLDTEFSRSEHLMEIRSKDFINRCPKWEKPDKIKL